MEITSFGNYHFWAIFQKFAKLFFKFWKHLHSDGRFSWEIRPKLKNRGFYPNFAQKPVFLGFSRKKNYWFLKCLLLTFFPSLPWNSTSYWLWNPAIFTFQPLDFGDQKNPPNIANKWHFLCTKLSQLVFSRPKLAKSGIFGGRLAKSEKTWPKLAKIESKY